MCFSEGALWTFQIKINNFYWKVSNIGMTFCLNFEDPDPPVPYMIWILSHRSAWIPADLMCPVTGASGLVRFFSRLTLARASSPKMDWSREKIKAICVQRELSAPYWTQYLMSLSSRVSRINEFFSQDKLLLLAEGYYHFLNITRTELWQE